MAAGESYSDDKSTPPSRAPSAEERSKAFAWFKALGFPDVKEIKFVRGATGRWLQFGDEPPRNDYIRGFLLQEKGDRFTIVSLSLLTETFTKTPAGTAIHRRIGYEASELAAGATAYLRALQKVTEEGGDNFRFRGYAYLHQRTETFVLAWVCWRNGLDKLAADLFDYAAKMPTGYGYNGDKPPTRRLRDLVADDLADAEMWRAVMAFEDPDMSRPRLLERFERICKNYHYSEHHKRAKETVALLRKMVKEDEEHAAKKPAKTFAQLSKKEQIAERIFRLRDQGDIFDDLREVKKDTPAHELMERGYDAVPQLIEALEDQRFTRSVSFDHRFYSSQYILRVGDRALAILERIAAQSFWRPTSTFSHISKDKGKGVADAKRKVQAWYDEIQKKGEKRFLIEATERGDGDSYNQALRLIERYPDAALPAILAGIKAAKDEEHRELLVDAVGTIKGDGPLPFLLREVREGPSAYGRVVAAEALHKRGRPDGVSAMIREWKGHQSPRSQQGQRPRDRDATAIGLGLVAGFLASSGEVDAIKALAKDFRKLPVNLRMMVIQEFGRSGSLSVLRTGDSGALQPGGKSAPKKKDLHEAIEELLIVELDDIDELVGMSGTWDGKHFSDPRLCDVAGHILSQREPDLYSFDLGAPLPRRNRGIIEMKNVWRKRHGLAPLPLPAPKVIAPIPRQTLLPLLEALVSKPGGQPGEIEARIERLGLGALPDVLDRLNKTGKDAPERGVLERLARRLACIVDGVVIAEGSIKPNAAFAARLEAMKGKPFEPDAFLSLVRLPVEQLPAEVYALRFSVNRTGDGTGVTLRVHLLDEIQAKELDHGGSISPDPKTQRNAPYGWSFSQRVSVGGKGLLGSSGVCTHSHWLEEKHVDLRDALRQACLAAPSEPIEVRLHLIAHKGQQKE
jgi:hypothetical protein